MLNFETVLGKIRIYNHESIESVLSLVVPYSKIVYLYTEQTYLSIKQNSEITIKGTGLKSIDLILKPERVLSIEKACELFNIPEDVRAIVVTEKSLYPNAQYLGTIRQIPVFFYPLDGDFKGALDSQVYIKNGDKIDDFYINTDRYLFYLDDNKTLEHYFMCYACLLCDLLDALFQKTLINSTKDLDKIEEMLFTAEDLTKNFSDCNDYLHKIKNAYYSLNVYKLNNAGYLKNSSCKVCALVLTDTTNDYVFRFLCALEIISTFNADFFNSKDIAIINYQKMVIESAKNFNVNSKNAFIKINEQNAQIDINKFSFIKNELKSTIIRLSKIFKDIRVIYEKKFFKNVKIHSEISKAVKLACFAPFDCGALRLIRDGVEHGD